MLRVLEATHPFRDRIVEVFSVTRLDHIRPLADRYLREGYSLRWDDGSLEELIELPDEDSTKTGSDRYTWSSDGNRIRYRRYIRYESPSGEIELRELSPVWRNY